MLNSIRKRVDDFLDKHHDQIDQTVEKIDRKIEEKLWSVRDRIPSRQLASNFFDRVLARREQGVDALVQEINGYYVFVPISERAKEGIPKIIQGGVIRHGGYVVPRELYRDAYEALHKGPCPLMGAMGGGPLSGVMIIDT